MEVDSEAAVVLEAVVAGRGRSKDRPHQSAIEYY
jgi:hypothetical protein